MGDHFAVDCDHDACTWVIVAGGGDYDFVAENLCVCHVCVALCGVFYILEFTIIIGVCQA